MGSEVRSLGARALYIFAPPCNLYSYSWAEHRWLLSLAWSLGATEGVPHADAPLDEFEAGKGCNEDLIYEVIRVK